MTLLFVLLRYTRLGIRIRAGTLDLETVAALGINVQMLRSLNFAVGIYLAGLSGVLAAGQLGLEPTMGTGLLMPSFIAIIVGGIGSLPGTLVGGLLIGVASGLTAVFLPAASEAVIYVHDGGGAAAAAARAVRRRRNDELSAEQTRKLIVACRRSGSCCCLRPIGWCRSAAIPRSPPACWCSGWPRCR